MKVIPEFSEEEEEEEEQNQKKFLNFHQIRPCKNKNYYFSF